MFNYWPLNLLKLFMGILHYYYYVCECACDNGQCGATVLLQCETYYVQVGWTWMLCDSLFQQC
jgi:hypothetical protein